MDSSKKEYLKQQLTAQANSLVTEPDDIQLAKSLVSVCRAFVDNALSAFPKNAAETDFEDILAVLSGIVKVINDFLGSTANAKVTEMRQKAAELQTGIGNLTNEIANINLPQVQKKYDKSAKNLEETKVKAEKLRNEIKRMNSEASEINNTHDALVAEAEEAKKNYEDIQEYENIVKKIEDGIKGDNFTDINAFIEYTNELNKKSGELKKDYDAHIKKIVDEVEELQKNIEKRQDPKKK